MIKRLFFVTLLSVALVSGTATAAFATDHEIIQARDKVNMT